MPLECRRTGSLRVHERAGNHEEFQIRIDYIGICGKARTFLLRLSVLKNFLAIRADFPEYRGFSAGLLRSSSTP
jgi:hypothetical protein